MVARFEQSHGHKQNGRHAAGGGCGSFRAFQRGQALLERGYGGVGRAGVGVAVFRKRKVVRRSFAVGLHKAAAQIQRFGVFTILAARCCGADGMGFGLPRGMAGLVGGGCRHVAGFNGDRMRVSEKLIYALALSAGALGGRSCRRRWISPWVISPVTYTPSKQEESTLRMAGLSVLMMDLRASRSW